MQTSLPEPTEIFARAWGTLSEHLGILVASVFIMGGLFVALYILLMIAMFGAVFGLRGDPLLFQVVNNAISGVFGILILWGYIGFAQFTLELARGAEPQLMTLFRGLRALPNYFLTNSVVQLISLLLFLPIVGVVAIPVYALWDTSATTAQAMFQANLPAMGLGLALFASMMLAMIPLTAASTVSIYFAMDRDLDPLASMTAGLRAVRPHIVWTYKFGALAMVVGLAMGAGAMTCIGLVVVIPFVFLFTAHYYLAFAEVVEAQLVADERAAASAASAEESVATAEASAETVAEASAETVVVEETAGAAEPHPADALDAPSAADAAPTGPAGSVGGQVGGEPEFDAKSDPKSNPYQPPDAPVYRRPDRSHEVHEPGQVLAAPLPPGARRFRADPSGAVTPIAVACLVPWVLAGGNPFSGVVVGYLLARRFGFPDYLGAVTGVGVLLLCGVAALVVLLIGWRGRREVIVDGDGFALDGNERWTGQRLAWSEIRGFRITGRGVELFPRGPWGWIWRPVVPTQDRDTHDLVEALEARGVLRA